MFMFRSELDALARYLTANYGFSGIPEFNGQVQPPSNYPMVLQTAVIRISEAVQAMQDWTHSKPIHPRQTCCRPI